MTLYLKYRPQTIDDLDLTSVRDSLKATLSKEDIPHAFLFAGPKGTGKTSAARIVAKAINCEERKIATTSLSANAGNDNSIEPCNVCSSCTSITRGENLDVIEIDAASHRGIDDIRILREAVKLAPIGAKHKIYIIDEAHMLTTEACNALLKVLEEPPSHVIFILATTNPEKLLDTIRSRTVLIPFTKATKEDVVGRLLKVSEGEGVKVSEDVLGLIGKAADGAFRDAVKIFEQVLLEKVELTNDGISDFLFGKKNFDPALFIQTLESKQTKEALELIEHGCQNGVSAKTMAKGILDILRAKLLEESRIRNQEPGKLNSLIELIELFSKAYSEIPNAYLEQLPLEIAVVRYTNEEIKNEKTEEKKEIGQIPKKGESAPEESEKRKAKSEKGEEGNGQIVRIEEERQIADQSLHRARSVVRNDEEKVIISKRMTSETDAIVTDGAFSDATWVQVLTEIRPKNAATEALLRACKPLSFNGKVLEISVYYKFHKERLESHPHRDLLEETLGAILGNKIRVNCQLTEPPVKIQQEAEVRHEVVLTEAKNDGTILKVAKDIFGS